MKEPVLSLIIPCFNEERTIELCISRVLNISGTVSLEVVVVDDASTDSSYAILNKIAEEHSEVTVLRHQKNRGKGAALRTGFLHAAGDYIGIQDADNEYDPGEYNMMLEPLLDGRADVVYGSRYLRPDTRRVLYFWHTWMNKSLTFVSNMFTDLDISDMETCYKCFSAEVIKKIAPELREERFGFEPEITAKVAEAGCRVYECAISYNPRTYEEGKKISWKDGFHALYCILHYSAHRAPLPMQILLYLFIGFVSMVVNLVCFAAARQLGLPLGPATIGSFCVSALCNYILCVLLLFRHKARFNTTGEIGIYILSVAIIGCIDYYITKGLVLLECNEVWAKFWASIIGFAGNFIVRKFFIFSEKKGETVYVR
jgi:glycosyltransferase involved in cell wall biosynthesis